MPVVYSCSKIAWMRGLSWMELFLSKVTMGNISLGISLEKGSSLVPIPPAVMSALYSPKSAGTGPLAEKLEGMGENVTLFDLDFNSNTRSLNCAKVRGNVLDYGSVLKMVNGKDAVFHFAAVSRVAWGQEDPFKCWQTNQMGTLNVLEACRKTQIGPVLFYASSREVYGEPLYLPVNENHPKKPISVYGMTKLCAERT